MEIPLENHEEFHDSPSPSPSPTDDDDNVQAREHSKYVILDLEPEEPKNPVLTMGINLSL
jgi:hypothetical protein